MSTVEEIKSAISRLPRKEVVRLSDWFEDFEAKEWDREFEENVQNGKFRTHAKRNLTDIY